MRISCVDVSDDNNQPVAAVATRAGRVATRPAAATRTTWECSGGSSLRGGQRSAAATGARREKPAQSASSWRRSARDACRSASGLSSSDREIGVAQVSARAAVCDCIRSSDSAAATSG